MLHAYCPACRWSGSDRAPDGTPRLVCPLCAALITVVQVGPLLIQPPEPEPDEPQQREPLPEQPRLL